jgi:hypothetical protein
MANYPPCPTPTKVGYLKLSDALKAADALTRFGTEPYFCPCCRYHLRNIAKRERKHLTEGVT